MKSLFLLFCFSGIVSSCTNSNVENSCFSFDERQCYTDPWYDQSPVQLNTSEKEALILQFLNGKDLNIMDIRIDPDFHQVVCEACHSCPSGARIFVSSSDQILPILEDLDLLNPASLSCSKAFP